MSEAWIWLNCRCATGPLLSEIRTMILLTKLALKNGNLENEGLMQLNQIICVGKRTSEPGRLGMCLRQRRRAMTQLSVTAIRRSSF